MIPLLLVALAAIVSTAPPTAIAADADQSLTMAAARAAARPVAWEVARRNHLVNSVQIHSCRRRAAVRISCLALDRGSTSTHRTTCKVWVQVRLVNSLPTATLKHVDCENDRLSLLRAATALAAMQPPAEALGGAGVRVGGLTRLSRLEFLASAGWERPAPSSPGESEFCGVTLHALLLDTGEVTVTAGEPGCILPR